MTEEEKAWLQARKNGIGGSDAACILGLNPWKSNLDLWREKVGLVEPEDISSKPAVLYGKEAEAPLRRLFELDHPEIVVSYDQYGMIANDKSRPWLFATLDGDLTYGQKKGILEVKTTEIRRPGDWSKWSDRVPDNYYVQLLHQLLATGYDFAVLLAQIKWRKNGRPQKAIREYTFWRNEVQDDLDYLLPEEDSFWRAVQEKKQPALILPSI